MRAVPLALLLCLTAGGSLRAQSIPSPFRYIEPRQGFGAFVGYLWTNPEVEVDSAQGEIALGPRSAPLFGIRYNYRLGGPVVGEASLAFAPSDRKVFRGEPIGGDSAVVSAVDTEDTADAPLALAEVGLRLSLTGDRTWNGLAPFVGATGGVVTDLGGSGGGEEEIPDAQRFDFGPGFAVGATVGTEWFPTDRLSLRAELRDTLWRVEVPAGLRSGTGDDPSRWTQNFGVTVGGAIHF